MVEVAILIISVFAGLWNIDQEKGFYQEAKARFGKIKEIKRNVNINFVILFIFYMIYPLFNKSTTLI